MDSTSSPCGSFLCTSKRNSEKLIKLKDKKSSVRGNSKASGRAQSRTDQSTDRTLDSEERTYTPPLNLTLYGSPAPRCSQRATNKVRKPAQPPNTPSEVTKPRKPLQLPIDKILLLNERLELNKAEKIKLELSSRQIKLSDDEDFRNKSSRSENYEYFQNHSNFSSCDEIEKHGDFLSPTLDLSIDLSSVTNSDHDTESSSEEMEGNSPEYAAHMPNNKFHVESESTSTCSQSPVRYVWNNANAIGSESIRSYKSTPTSYPWTRTSRRSTGSSSGPFTDVSNDYSDRVSEAGRRTEEGSPKCPRARSADLIHVYVNTVNNHKKLSKYFRPCRTCKEACCVCPDVVPDTSRTFYFRPASCVEKLDSARTSNGQSSGCSNFSDKKKTSGSSKSVYNGCASDSEDNQASQLERQTPEHRPDSRCSDFSVFLHERCCLGFDKQRPNVQGSSSNVSGNDFDAVFDSGMSTFPFDENNDSDDCSPPGQTSNRGLSKKQISLSVMQLATAAQCARILANSLESVLEIVHQDSPLSEHKNLIEFENSNIEDLVSSLDVLKCSFPLSSGKATGSNDFRQSSDIFISNQNRVIGDASCSIKNNANWADFESNECDFASKNGDVFFPPLNGRENTEFVNCKSGSSMRNTSDSKKAYCFEDNFDEYFVNYENRTSVSENQK